MISTQFGDQMARNEGQNQLNNGKISTSLQLFLASFSEEAFLRACVPTVDRNNGLINQEVASRPTPEQSAGIISVCKNLLKSSFSSTAESDLDGDGHSLSLNLALHLLLLPGTDKDSRLSKECLQFLSEKTGQAFELNEMGVLEIKVTQPSAATDELFECLTLLNDDKRSKINFHICAKEGAGKDQVEELVQQYGSQADSLSIETNRIDDNDFEEVAKNCSNLKHLFIRNANVTKVPKFERLTTLDCAWCENLKEIPQLDNLTTLLCHWCYNLEEIPQLDNLTTLDCRACYKLQQIPQLEKLTSLDCDGCKDLKEVPQLNCLTTLNCSECHKLRKIPQLNCLTTLDCSECHKLQSIPQLDNLTTLNCSNCYDLQEIPQLDNLTTLNCGVTGIQEIPRLTRLTTLDCHRCENLEEIPQLDSLTTLNCRCCYELQRIPQLETLTTLDCSYCHKIGERAKFICLLQVFFNDKERSIGLANGFGFESSRFKRFVVDYFDSEEEVVISQGESGTEQKMTKGALRIEAFNQFPFLFEYVFGLLDSVFLSELPQEMQDAVDSGQIREMLNDKYPNIGSKVLSHAPLFNKDLLYSIDLIELGLIDKKHLPKRSPIKEQGSFKELAAFLGNDNNEEWREQQDFCKVIRQCEILISDLRIPVDEIGVTFAKDMVESTCRVKASKKVSWSDFLSLIQVGNDEKDAIDDFIKTVFIPYYMQNNLADDETSLTAESLYREKREQMLMDFLKGVSANEIAMLSKRWHDPRRSTQLSGAKTYSNERWEPLFTGSLKYTTQSGKVIHVVPLTNSRMLEEEGKKLSHCVKTYTNACLKENSHILSLRDEEGNSLSTIELKQRQGKGGKSDGVLNIEGESSFHLELNQHRAKNNNEPPAECLEVQKLLFEDMRKGGEEGVVVNLSELAEKREERLELLRSKSDLLLVGYDPTDKESFVNAAQLYRFHGIGVKASKRLKRNFDELTGGKGK